MAELLRWSAGISLPKKRQENQLGGSLTISSLKNPLQIGQTVNNQIRANKASGFKQLTNNSGGLANNSFQQQNNFQQQNDFQAQQAEQQRRQQEEQQRQQRIEQMRQQQEARQRQEQEKGSNNNRPNSKNNNNC